MDEELLIRLNRVEDWKEAFERDAFARIEKLEKALRIGKKRGERKKRELERERASVRKREQDERRFAVTGWTCVLETDDSLVPPLSVWVVRNPEGAVKMVGDTREAALIATFRRTDWPVPADT